jgi:hypothetical protein
MRFASKFPVAFYPREAYTDNSINNRRKAEKRRNTMSDQINEADILAAVNAEVAGMKPEDLKAELLKHRVRQKVQMKKNYGSGKQKEYQAKQRAKQKALKEAAIKLGIWDQINEQADELAEQKLAEDATETETDEVETTA